MLCVLRILALVLVLPVLSLPAVAQDNPCGKPLILRATEDYRPFIFRQEDGQPGGIDIQFITRLLDGMGCEYRFVFEPWKRSILLLQEGRVDVMLVASITEERLKFARFSAPYRNETVGLVMRRGEADVFDIQELEDLLRQDVRIGHIQGSYRGRAFEELLADPRARTRVIGVNFTDQAVKMLARNRIDFFVEMPAVALAEAAKYGLDHLLQEHPLVINREPVHFMFSKKTVSRAVVDRINAQLRRMMDEGWYDAFYGSMAIDAKPVM